MISFLTGKIRSITSDPPRAVVMVGGVGYEVNLPAYVSEALTANGVAAGDEIGFEIYSHATERNPRPYLVGFLSESERVFFEQLIDVEGIGPSKAVSALTMPPAQIANAIETSDSGTLTLLPGIGARAAQKMIATLKGRVATSAFPAISLAGGENMGKIAKGSEPIHEAVQVLVGLGYRQTEARLAVEKALRANPDANNDVTELVREVFKTDAANN